MKNLRISTKLALAYLLFLIPIIYLVVIIYNDKRDLIDFAKLELSGTHYIDSLRTAQEALIEPTGMAAKRAADLIANVEARFGAIAGVSDPATTLISTLQKPDLADFGALRSSVQDLIGKVAGGSNLTLDTDLDSFYVMDAVTGKVPDLIGRLEGLS